MKNKILILLMLLAVTSCVLPSDGDPYADTLCSFTIRVTYPTGYADRVRAGVPVTLEEINLGTMYQKETDDLGVAEFSVPVGLYRVSISDMDGEDIFNGSADKVRAGRTGTVLAINLLHSRAGSIVIKEIYCGGCKRLPQEGNYQFDQYLILHNNDYRVQSFRQEGSRLGRVGIPSVCTRLRGGMAVRRGRDDVPAPAGRRRRGVP